MVYQFYVRDAEREEEGNLAVLKYDESAEEYEVHIRQDCDYTALPAILQCWAGKGVFELRGKEALRFVKERVIPPDRQNLGEIMRKVGMQYYDEFPLLRYTSGRCCQDENYLVEIEEWEKGVYIDGRKKF